MAGPRQRFGWINDKDERQVEWATRYLRKQPNAPLTTNGTLSERLERLLCEGPPHKVLDRHELVGRMEKAWYQQARRIGKENGDSKPYSYEMSTKVGPALERLSEDKRLPIHKVLEDLILNTAEFRKRLADEQREKIAEEARRHKHALTRQTEGRTAAELTAKAWEEEAESLTTQNCRYRVALQANGLLDEKSQLAPLEPSLERKAVDLSQEWMANLKKAVKTRVNKATATDTLPPKDQYDQVSPPSHSISNDSR